MASGHVGDAMWYNGSNIPRPIVAGTPAAKGITVTPRNRCDVSSHVPAGS